MDLVADQIKRIPPDQLEKLLAMIGQINRTVNPEAMLEHDDKEVLSDPIGEGAHRWLDPLNG